jgi:hypothetical protein
MSPPFSGSKDKDKQEASIKQFVTEFFFEVARAFPQLF